MTREPRPNLERAIDFAMTHEVQAAAHVVRADRRWFANWLRVGASPTVAYALNRAFDETDLRDVLPAVASRLGAVGKRASACVPANGRRDVA